MAAEKDGVVERVVVVGREGRHKHDAQKPDGDGPDGECGPSVVGGAACEAIGYGIRSVDRLSYPSQRPRGPLEEYDGLEAYATAGPRLGSRGFRRFGMPGPGTARLAFRCCPLLVVGAWIVIEVRARCPIGRTSSAFSRHAGLRLASLYGTHDFVHGSDRGRVLPGLEARECFLPDACQPG